MRKLKTRKKAAAKKLESSRFGDQYDFERSALPIVAIGASAGGLEAIEQFFAHMPADSGMAFIIITHLDRTHVSIMPELIKKYTDMQVFSIRDGMKVNADTVYVIPPNTNITINDGILHFAKQPKPHYLNLPINFFLEALAEDRKENAMAIILSGTGSDGSLGIKAIKSQEGLVIAQDPVTAKYDGMPQSAVNTGLTDYILPIEQMPDYLLKHLHHGGLNEKKISAEIQQIFSILRMHTGHDFTSYKINTIYRRIKRQMLLHQINLMADYVKFLREHPHEIKTLFKDLLIGVTSFFRDPGAFEVLKQSIIPKLLKNKTDQYCIRIWIPGCSTGEEVYSIAIILKECLEEMKSYVTIQIFATDIDFNALETARAGLYPESIENEISSERLKRFFIKENNAYRIRKEIREIVVFGAQNIIKDPPFTKLDIICCRNLLIYFNTALQKKLFPIFHFSLKPKGILFLGTSEAIGGYDDLFKLVAKKWKIFERKDADAYPYIGFNFSPVSYNNEFASLPAYKSNPAVEKNEMHDAIREFLIDNFAPTCLIINKKGDIIYSQENAHAYLSLGAKIDGNNLLAIFPLKIKRELTAFLRKTGNRPECIEYNNFPIKNLRKKPASVNLKISRIIDHNRLDNLFLVVLEKTATKPARKLKTYGSTSQMLSKITELEDELQDTKETLQATIEELQSSNEELQSTNEELQSTNEEIETSKEELQSLNEELVSVNSELENKLDQLASIHDDMNNLFNSTEIAAIFLDNDLHVKRFTPKVQELVRLIPSDIGRSIQDFATNIKYKNLINEIKEVQKTLIPKQFEARSKNSKDYLVRILPYRTLSNMIDGVIITFDDISAITSHKKNEKKLQELNEALNESINFTMNIIDSVSDPMLVLSGELKIISANQSFYQFFNVNIDETLNKYIYQIGSEQWNIPELRIKLEEVIKKDINFKSFEIDHEFARIGHKKLILSALRILRNEIETNTILLKIREK